MQGEKTDSVWFNACSEPITFCDIIDDIRQSSDFSVLR